MRIAVTVHSADLSRVLRELRDQSPVAVSRALNRTITNVQTGARREISADTGLPVRRVGHAMKLERATRSKLRAALQVRGARIPLIDFKARQTRKGVSYRLPTGRGSLPGGFIARMRSGHVGVFKRVGKSRLPIGEKFGPSLPRVFLQARVTRVLHSIVETQMAKNLQHEVNFLLRRTGAA